MDKFIPYNKLSKKEKRKRNRQNRRMWDINPITRVPKNSKAYDRNEMKREVKDYD